MLLFSIIINIYKFINMGIDTDHSINLSENDYLLLTSVLFLADI